MSLGKKLPLEPLGEQRWARIERQLFERVARGEGDAAEAPFPPSARPRWRMAAALVVAGAAAAIAGGVAWRALGTPTRITTAATSRIATDATGSRVAVGEAALEIAPRSEVSVSGDDASGITVVLQRGRVECEVPPRNGRPRFAVEAGDVVVRVVGTHFSVERGASGVEVEVERGTVEVTRGPEHAEVHAGETWPNAAPAASVQPSASAQSSATAAPSSAAPAASAAPPTPRELYESASRLEASRPDVALAIYRDLASKGGAWGANALFAEGRLESDRGHRGEARRLLGAYLARYPSGQNARDAQQLLERL